MAVPLRWVRAGALHSDRRAHGVEARWSPPSSGNAHTWRGGAHAKSLLAYREAGVAPAERRDSEWNGAQQNSTRQNGATVQVEDGVPPTLPQTSGRLHEGRPADSRQSMHEEATTSGRDYEDVQRRPSSRLPRPKMHLSGPAGLQLLLTANIRNATSCWDLYKGLSKAPSASFNHINVTAALVKLARLVNEQGGPAKFAANVVLEEREAAAGVARRLTELLQRVMPQMDARGVANALYAYAKLEYSPGEEVLSALTSQLRRVAARMKAQEVANSTWACVSLELIPPPALLTRMSELAFHRQLRQQDVAQLVYALGKLGLKPQPAVLREMCRELVGNPKALHAQHAAGALYGFALLGLNPGAEVMTRLSQDLLAATATQLSPQPSPPPPTDDKASSEAATHLRDEAAHADQQLSSHTSALAPDLSPLKISAPSPSTAASTPPSVEAGQLTGREVSNALWAFATLDYFPGDAIMEALAREVEARSDFSPQGLANTLWAFARVEYRAEEGVMDAIVGRVAGRVAELKCEETAMLLWALGQLEYPLEEGLFQALANHAAAKVSGATGQAFGNCMWAFAKFGQNPGEAVLARFLAVLEEKLDDDFFDDQALSDAMWALAKLGHSVEPDLLSALLEDLQDRLPNCTPQAIAKSLWALAKLGADPDEEFVAAVADEVRDQIGEFNPQDTANVLWAFAHGRWPCPPALLAMLERHALRLARSFNPQDVSNTLWALVRLRQPGLADRRLLEALAVETGVKLEDFKPDEVANTVWAFARLRYKPSGELLHAIADVTFSHITGFSAGRVTVGFSAFETVRVLWGFAALGFNPGDLVVHALARKICSRAEELDTIDLHQTLFALAQLRHNPGPMELEALGRQVAELEPAFTPTLLLSVKRSVAALCLHQPPAPGTALARILELDILVKDSWDVS